MHITPQHPQFERFPYNWLFCFNGLRCIKSLQSTNDQTEINMEYNQS